MSHQNKWLIIPAGGSGLRFGESIPKQYLSLSGKTVLEHTLSLFLKRHDIAKVVISLAANDVYFSELAIAKHPKIQTVLGGKTRAESVINAMTWLKEFAASNDWVIVHDSVRPCLHVEDLIRLMEVLQDDDVGGILATPVSDTLKLGENNYIQQTVSRSNVWQALTPQMFRFQKLLQALLLCKEKGLTVTDEASALEAAGCNPKLVSAKHANPKLTFEKDLKLIALMLQTLNQEEYCS